MSISVEGNSGVLSGSRSNMSEGDSSISSNLVGRGSTSVSTESSRPLSVGKALEPSPDALLGSDDSSVVVSWALIDWSSGSKDFLEVVVVPAGLEEEDDDHDVEDTESDKAETEYLSTSEGSDETSVD